MNQTDLEDAVERPASTPDSTRRKLLGAIALGFVASACSSPEDESLSLNGGGDSPTARAGDGTGGGTDGGAIETGPELEKVTLPRRSGTDAQADPNSGNSDGSPADGNTADGNNGGGNNGGGNNGGGNEPQVPSAEAAKPADPAAPKPQPPKAEPPKAMPDPTKTPTSTANTPAPAAKTPAPVVPPKPAPKIVPPAPAPAPAPAPTPTTPTTAAPTTAATMATTAVTAKVTPKVGPPTTPTTAAPTTAAPTTPTTATPRTAPTTAAPTTATTAAPTTAAPTTAAPTTAAPTTAPPPPPPPVPGNVGTVHLANRLTFGITPSLQQQITALGTGGYLEDQLAKTAPDPATEARLGGFQLLRGGRKANYDRLRNDDDNRLRLELTHSTMMRGVYSDHQLFEMVCQLWMDHFNVNLLGENRTKHLQVDYQENVIRANAMGTFRNLLVATANSPAMLTYLNNDESDASSPQGVNENYGRELLELHTLGIDEAGNQIYTEADVRQAALAMSGWSIVTNTNAGNYSDFLFRDNFHHTGEVSILNGAWTSTGTAGKATGDSLVNFLATHPSTAQHIAFKMCRRFVGDAPSAALVQSTAAVFLANDTAIVPTLRHIFQSAEFAAAGNQKIRRPIESTIASLRALDSTVPNNPIADQAKALSQHLSDQGNEPWAWVEPNGYPDETAHWLSAGVLLNQWNLGARLARNNINGINTNYATIRPVSATGADLIINLGFQFGLGQMPAAAVTAVAQSAGVNPTAAASAVNNQSLADVAGLLLAHPIFQTR